MTGLSYIPVLWIPLPSLFIISFLQETTTYIVYSRVTDLCVGNSAMTGEFPHKGPVTQKMFPFHHWEQMRHTTMHVCFFLCPQQSCFIYKLIQHSYQDQVAVDFICSTWSNTHIMCLRLLYILYICTFSCIHPSSFPHNSSLHCILTSQWYRCINLYIIPLHATIWGLGV